MSCSAVTPMGGKGCRERRTHGRDLPDAARRGCASPCRSLAGIDGGLPVRGEMVPRFGGGEEQGTPLPKWGRAASGSAARRDARVGASGCRSNRAPRRTRSAAAAVATCCRCIVAQPRQRQRRPIPLRRVAASPPECVCPGEGATKTGGVSGGVARCPISARILAAPLVRLPHAAGTPAAPGGRGHDTGATARAPQGGQATSRDGSNDRRWHQHARGCRASAADLVLLGQHRIEVR
jgi:hypothetical protein